MARKKNNESGYTTRRKTLKPKTSNQITQVRLVPKTYGCHTCVASPQVMEGMTPEKLMAELDNNGSGHQHPVLFSAHTRDAEAHVCGFGRFLAAFFTLLWNLHFFAIECMGTSNPHPSNGSTVPGMMSCILDLAE